MPETNFTPVSTPPFCDNQSGSNAPSPTPIQEADGTAMISAQDQASQAPVRYFDGTVLLTSTDLSSDGFGKGWGQTRGWSNSPGYAPIDLTTNRPRSFNGRGMVDGQLPYVLANNNFTTAIVVTSGSNATYPDQEDAGGVVRPEP
jgi:hypothetical protein